MANELISALTKPKVKEALKEVKKEQVVKEKVEEKVSVKQEKMDDFAKMVFGREAKRPPKAGGASGSSGPSKNPPSIFKPPQLLLNSLQFELVIIVHSIPCRYGVKKSA